MATCAPIKTTMASTDVKSTLPLSHRDPNWVPFKQHSPDIVWKGNGTRAIFRPHVITTTNGEAHHRLVEWHKKLLDMYPDGEEVLVNNHLHTMLATVCSGGDVPMPLNNKYQIAAVEGLLITIQGFLDYHVKFTTSSSK